MKNTTKQRIATAWRWTLICLEYLIMAALAATVPYSLMIAPM